VAIGVDHLKVCHVDCLLSLLLCPRSTPPRRSVSSDETLTADDKRKKKRKKNT